MSAATLFLLALLGPLASKKLLGDFFSPLAVYIFFWAFALGALLLDWVSYDPLGPAAWAAFAGSFAAFVLGSLLPLLYAANRQNWRNARPKLDLLHRARYERGLLLLFLLGVFGFFIQMLHLHLEVGLSAFLTDPQRIRALHSNIKYLGFFNILNLATFVLGVLYLGLFRHPKRWVLGVLLFTLLTTFTSTDRTRFFYAVIWAFFAVVYARIRVHLTLRLAVAGLVTCLVLGGFFLLIARIYVKQAFDDNMEYINVPPSYALAIDPYIYLTGSFPVFQAVLEDPQESTHGRHTFELWVKLAQLLYPELERAEIVGKFYRVPVELNAATYLQPFYLDFGWNGLLLLPLLLGLLCSCCYLAMRSSKTLFKVYLCSLLAFCTCISIFINHFTQTGTLFFILVGWLFSRLVSVREPQEASQFRPGILPGLEA